MEKVERGRVGKEAKDIKGMAERILVMDGEQEVRQVGEWARWHPVDYRHDGEGPQRQCFTTEQWRQE